MAVRKPLLKPDKLAQEMERIAYKRRLGGHLSERDREIVERWEKWERFDRKWQAIAVSVPAVWAMVEMSREDGARPWVWRAVVSLIRRLRNR